MQFSVITLFPDLIRDVTKVGVVGQAVVDGKINVEVMTPRAWTTDLHKTVDDRPFGGGDGMVLMAEPLSMCLESILDSSLNLEEESSRENQLTPLIEQVTKSKPRMIFLSPQGRKLDHNFVMELAKEKHLLLLCGRYAGVDQRLIKHYGFEEVSIGDYVLSGGELGALVMIDAIGRQLEGVLGHESSSREDSFAKDGLLEAPCFTRPRVWKDWDVPDLLLSGNHKQIEEDRWMLSVLITFKKRTDLFQHYISNQSVKRKSWLKGLERMNVLSDRDLAAFGLEQQTLEDFKIELLHLKVI